MLCFFSVSGVYGDRFASLDLLFEQERDATRWENAHEKGGKSRSDFFVVLSNVPVRSACKVCQKGALRTKKDSTWTSEPNSSPPKMRRPRKPRKELQFLAVV
jgi:hypothetical protein